MKIQRFSNRVHAGQLLAAKLVKYMNCDYVTVLGMPRGGVPVAFEVARKLQAPLDVMVVRKLGVPGHEELAMGAIASGGIRVVNEMVVWNLGISQDMLDKVGAVELKELRRREVAYRGHEGVPDIAGKVVILVDDGIATGSTIQAAIKALQQQAPARLIVAVPVAPAETCGWLEGMVDEVICLLMPDDFRSVGQWYEDFAQTSDEEVTQLLKAARNTQPQTTRPARSVSVHHA